MEPTTGELYIKDCVVTESKDFAPIKERLQNFVVATNIAETLAEMKQLSTKLDVLKKHVFYGKTAPELQAAMDEWEKASEEERTEITDSHEMMGILNFSEAMKEDKNVRIFHGLVGLGSEYGEIVDALMNAWFDKHEIDTTNLKEELGDNGWYTSVVLDAVGSTYEEIWEMNKNKLQKKRYKNGFTESAAVNRDVEAERAELEKSEVQ